MAGVFCIRTPASRKERSWRLGGPTSAPPDPGDTPTESDPTSDSRNFTRRAGQGTLNDHSNTIVALAFSPDGQTLASAGADAVIHLWRPQSPTAPQRLAGHEGTVWALAFSPDGRTLASGGADGTVRLWNPAVGLELARLGTGDSAAGNSSQAPARLAFSPDGNLPAARLFDGTLRTWRAAEVAERPVTTRH